MFDGLTGRLSSIIDKIKGRSALTEADVKLALREVRVALLEADVALPIVKDFIAHVQEKAIGQDVLRSISAGQLVVKIVHDALIDFLGQEVVDIELNAVPPVVILMVGLQGSGKTSMTAKLGNYLAKKQKRKVLMASLDVYRPAAREQLQTLGQQCDVKTLEIMAEEKPLAITKRALQQARLEGYDVLILDTAGRLHIDQQLMDEVVAVRKLAQPAEVILVADAMTGQDAVTVAKEFDEKVSITAIALSRIDGDARGGAALSMRAVTGKPLKLLGTGEKPDQLELFHPDRIASRILGMGDVVSLVERAMESVDQAETEKLALQMQKGVFNFNMMESQLLQMNKMGGISSLMGMIPGVNKFQDKFAQAGVDDRFIKRQISIIRSMTKNEKNDARLINGSRKRRIALGSGTSVPEVNKLLKQFRDMSDMMKRMQKLGKKGFLRQGLQGLIPRR
ncbi:MAG: signal recognition particle protein [Alphaproteobacteria bacterium]|jgi:signal recognition particle subunit SRP54|nr:signal recognition particle protein [Alphaproteobacteria bacterium]MBP9777364.1 signal recognition particle protein [Alphaproteobacteria bacterium]